MVLQRLAVDNEVVEVLGLTISTKCGLPVICQKYTSRRTAKYFLLLLGFGILPQ